MNARPLSFPALSAFRLLLALVAIPTALTAGESGTIHPASNPLSAPEKELVATSAPLFQHYCFECHGDKKAKARINLQQMTAVPDFAGIFKNWE